MEHSDDLDLLRKWRTGDLRAGNRLIRKHYAYALGLAKRRLSSEDDAIEATQHAMKVLVQKEDVVERVEKIEEKRTLEPGHRTSITPFRAYLGRVVYFSVLTQSKRLAKQRRHGPLEDDTLHPGAPVRGASTLLADKEEEKLMIKAMRSLPIEDQIMFYYDFAGNKKRTEIAALLGMNEKKIYRRVHDAKRRLREKLQNYRDSPVRQSTLGGLETWLKSIHEKSP